MSEYNSKYPEYNPNAIEKKWQKVWDDNKTFHSEVDKTKKKYYPLVEFPYPSGQGLHVGHPRPYTALDIVARKRRLEGYSVMYPMGFDAFGLPTENYAIKNKIHPAKVTEENIKNFKEQLKSIGFSFDWDREVNTTDPEYYKWTQWIFIQLYKHGLAYKNEMSVNWCPSCQVGLANEEVVDGKCERCGTEVVHKMKNQWMLKITEYADRLIDDLDEVDYEDRIKAQQINWIGRSKGANVNFNIKDTEDKLTVYTTRPDTIFGVSYMVISPEHPILEVYKKKISNYNEVTAYQEEARKKSDFERAELNKDKTGVRLDGLSAINPLSGEEIPIWVSDYVLMSYGTGAIMAVPAHDTRDYEFAKEFDMPIVQVYETEDSEELPLTDINKGKSINSEFLNGLSATEAKQKAIEYIEEKKLGEATTNFKLRDWVFSRQRYWGEPIPMVYCEEHGWVPVDESELPIMLPEVETYEPTATGESPLSEIDEFVNTICPICGKPAKRETDTMPQWAGSSWYYLRYMDPHNSKAIASKEALNYYSPVDWYNGGMEHTTLHLLYSRFWHKFLYDLGIVPTKEPYKKRTSHGMILGEDHQKMSKSRGNVVNPDDIIRDYGADTLRCYEMFIGDFTSTAIWSDEGVRGCRKYLERVYNMIDLIGQGEGYSKNLEVTIHQTIKKVSEDFENLKFNTAIASLMTLSNEMRSQASITKDDFKTYIILLNPVAPHMTEELWKMAGFEGMLNEAAWPKYDDSKLSLDEFEMPVQVNGKMRGKVMMSMDASKDDAIEAAKSDNNIASHIENKEIRKIIYVPGKILNIVVG
ncbi:MULTISPECIES: leucine--tRNA ligase [Anaerococcus]|uniref:Leucine--tRNA ligase n=1 Tax=Anaerococcus nagyae TaxID=1755241 RepID=A0A3E2TJX7_9FIRM|nr:MULTISPECIES: leucine--tRNA ligase [Anaerococcus]MBP2069422.1 leucyl-tRNA synthetase [Anaerococcus nagyae]MDU1864285.1 leucine--tRNA ligase [Anaerococcus sp.]MDU2565806.1 leucine--tRNA ligase [Anaerococcus sp.]RGB77293.1 leucine--tRNA ligase [Anaerococcus nagyae]